MLKKETFFLHKADIIGGRKRLREGMKVEFSLYEDARGLGAHMVKQIESGDTMMIRLKVPRKNVANLIGKKAENVMKLANEANATIKVVPDETKTLPFQVCNITGDPEHMTHATKLVCQHLAAENVDPTTIVLSYMVPGVFVGRVIGKSGANIKLLKDGREIKVDFHDNVFMVGNTPMSEALCSGSLDDMLFFIDKFNNQLYSLYGHEDGDGAQGQPDMGGQEQSW